MDLFIIIIFNQRNMIKVTDSFIKITISYQNTNEKAGTVHYRFFDLWWS